jgi:hypothetical protein
MKNIPKNPKSMSFSGRGQRVDVFTFDDENIFNLLTVDRIEEDELEDLLSDMNEIFSETGGLIEECNLSFDGEIEFVINEKSIISKSKPHVFNDFIYLLIKIEDVAGIFDTWDLDGVDFDSTKIDIECECIQFTENNKINLILITLEGEYGDDPDYFGKNTNYYVCSSDGKYIPVILNSD